MLKHLYCKIPTKEVANDPKSLLQFIKANAFIDNFPSNGTANVQFITYIRRVPDGAIFVKDCGQFYDAMYTSQEVISCLALAKSPIPVAVDDSIILNAKKYLDEVVNPEKDIRELAPNTVPITLSCFFCVEQMSFCIVTCIIASEEKLSLDPFFIGGEFKPVDSLSRSLYEGDTKTERIVDTMIDLGGKNDG